MGRWGDWYTGAMPMLWAQTVSFELVEPGDVLPVVIRWETEESIARVNSRWQGEPENGEPAGELCEEAVGEYVVELLGKGVSSGAGGGAGEFSGIGDGGQRQGR